MVRQFVDPVSSCFRFPPQLPQHLHSPKQQQHTNSPIAKISPSTVRAIIPAHHVATCDKYTCNDSAGNGNGATITDVLSKALQLIIIKTSEAVKI